MDYVQLSQHCLELIRKYLQLFITQVYINKYGQDNYKVYLDNNTLSNSNPSYMSDVSSSNFTKYDDALYYMNLFLSNFPTLSSALSSNYAVTLIHSLRFFRNRIAHQAPLSLRMVYRFVDETQCLLEELNLGQGDIATLDVVRKELMKQMINCNDNLSVIGKNRFNVFEEVNVEMKIDNEYSNKTENEKLSGALKDKAVSNDDVKEVNSELVKLSEKLGVTYIDVFSKLVLEDGNLNSKYTDDGLHLNSVGYDTVTEVLSKYVED